MKLVIQNLKVNKTGKAQIMPIGDIHLGAKNCLEDLVREKINQCVKDKIYVIGMGDMIEMADRRSPGSGVYEQTSPQEQIDKTIELFRPLQKEGLLLGILRGNHENRANKESGLDVVSLMCKALQTPYLGSSCNCLLRVGDHSYRVFATHGKRSSSFLEGKIKAAKSIFSYVNTDLILYAHTHGLGKDTLKYYEISKKRKVLETKYKHVVLTGSFLGYEGSYAEDSNLHPSMEGCPLISLDPTLFQISVEI